MIPMAFAEKALFDLIRRLRRDDRGATAIEYGLIAAGIGLAIIGSVMIVGDGLSSIFGVVGSTLSSANKL